MFRALRPENALNQKLPTVATRNDALQGERGDFYTLVSTKSGPASAYQSQSKASQGSCHVHDMS